MKSQITKLAIVCAMALSIGDSTCQAGPILDWLFPNRAARREASSVGQVTFRVPVGAYQYNMSGYSPTTSYRSVWAPVPVTQYRPVSYVNPLSTGTQTNMLPCSTQEWQARRVPYTAYQPSSLFGGGSGWQTVGQSVPAAASYPSVTAGYGGAQVNYERSWVPVTPSGVTANYGSASPIDDGWTVVGSGVSYAAPAEGGTGLLSYGSDPTTVRRAGYPDAQSFSPNGSTPLPSSMEQQSTWRPINSEYDDVCQNAPSDYDSTLLGSENSSAATQETPWVPIEPKDGSDDRHRTQVTQPADESPSLDDRTKRSRIDPGLEGDPYRWKALPGEDKSDADGELAPVRPQIDTTYQPPKLGTKSRQVRPAMTRQNAPNYGGDASRARDDAAGTVATPAPYLKPIPDLNRQLRRPNNPGLLDDADERTARGVRVAPDRQAVPIDWKPVDINRQGGLTRLKNPATTANTNAPAPVMDLTPAQIDDEGGWQRVR